MAEGWFKTMCALVGMAAGGIAIYRATVVEPVDEKDAAPFIQALSATGETGVLSRVAPDGATDIYLKLRNLGKRDAVEVKVNPQDQTGADWIIAGEGIPVVWGPREEVTLHLSAFGTPAAVAAARPTGERDRHYQYSGSVEWLDRASGKTGRNEWCFEGYLDSVANPMMNIGKEASLFKPFPLDPCHSKEATDHPSK